MRTLWRDRKCQAEERASVRAAEARKRRSVEVSRTALVTMQRSFYDAVIIPVEEDRVSAQMKLKSYRRSVQEMRQKCADSVRAQVEVTVQRSRLVMNEQTRMSVTAERARALQLELSSSVDKLTRGGLLPDGLFRAIVAFI